MWPKLTNNRRPFGWRLPAQINLLIFLIFTCNSEAANPQQPQAQAREYPIVNLQPDRTADLSLLINETLAINNKTAAGGQSSSKQTLIKDEWTFDMVEYDLMEFLQDLSARYKQNNRTNSPVEEESPLEAKTMAFSRAPPVSSDSKQQQTVDDANKTDPSNNSQLAPEKYHSKHQHPTEIPLLSTSLASGDHEIAESSWQYGIFDRFTRPRSSTKPPTTSSSDSSAQYGSAESASRFDVRQFNSDECGLRTYDLDQVQLSYPQQVDSSTDEIKPSNGLSLGLLAAAGTQKRQRLPLSALDRKKFQMPASISELISEDPSSNKRPVDNLDAQFSPAEDISYDSSSGSLAGGGSGSDSLPSDSNHLSESEFNLASRRHWLQQQLGNTLQALGFNLTNQSSISEIYQNHTNGLSLNFRENMMKKSGKFGRSLDENLDPTLTPGSGAQSTLGADSPASQSDPQAKLNARQDELKLEARVIGGSDARLGDSPWSVSLQALVSRPGTGAVEYRHYCGGTIISEYYILTAAHCLDFMVGRESRLFVVVGDLNWRMSTASLHGRRFGIEKLIIHSGYKSTAFGHDIGLIRTKESMKPLKVNGRYIINSVCLPQRGVEHSGEAELVGWGLFSNRNEMADALQIADVPILPRPLCVDLYRRRTGLIQWLIGIELITEKQVCAGTFGRGICQGDSGSALVVNEKVNSHLATRRSKGHDLEAKRLRIGLGDRETKQTRATIIGIVAFGGIRRCSYQSLPGVYMQTSKYMDWILPRIMP